MKNFFCPRSDIRFLFYFFSFVFILAPSSAGAAQVSLAWAKSTGAAGYKMHYGNYSGNYQYTVNVGNSTSCTISGLEIGKTYYYAVTAYDTQNNESDFSNEVAHTVVSYQDLKYTPVTPCRVADTRKAGGAISAGGIRSYNVRGAVASQGGNSGGCPSPKGEPLAVHVNVTSVPLGNGWITAYPYNSTAPTASIVNYRSDAQNVANSGTIKTCFNCAKDINIKIGGGTTHAIIDVLGYYYAAPQ